MKLSNNFTLEELVFSQTALNRGILNIPSDIQISNLKNLCVNILQPIRDKFNGPIIVTSGFRSPNLNKLVGGAKSSQHLTGEAADIKCQNNDILWNLIISMIKNKEIIVGQLIDEKNLSWIHISLPSPNHQNQILHQ